MVTVRTARAMAALPAGTRPLDQVVLASVEVSLTRLADGAPKIGGTRFVGYDTAKTLTSHTSLPADARLAVYEADYDMPDSHG